MMFSSKKMPSNIGCKTLTGRWPFSVFASLSFFFTVAIAWRHGAGSTLAQAMACCLTAPRHYLNQCQHSLDKGPVTFTCIRAIRIDLGKKNKRNSYKFSVKFPRAQWVKTRDAAREMLARATRRLAGISKPRELPTDGVIESVTRASHCGLPGESRSSKPSENWVCKAHKQTQAADSTSGRSGSVSVKDLWITRDWWLWLELIHGVCDVCMYVQSPQNG